jgi:TniQ
MGTIMGGWFTDPFPNELFYSACARYTDRIQYPHLQDIVNVLFGSRTVRAVFDLPRRLEQFIGRLPPGHTYTVDRLIDEHTLLPFYAPFVRPNRLRTLRSHMRTNYGISIHNDLGVSSWVAIPQWFRFCPHCVVEYARLTRCFL